MHFWISLLAPLLFGAEVTASPSAQLAELQSLAQHRVHRGVPQAPKIPESAYLKALSGEVVSGIEGVEGVAAAKGWGLMLMKLPVEQVWATVNDETIQPGVMPVSHSLVIGGERWQEERMVFQYMPLPFPISDRWWMTQVHFSSKFYTASEGRFWEMYWTDKTHIVKPPTQVETLVEDGIPVAWSRGAWLLIEIDEQTTLVEYYVWSDPGGLLPAGPASKFAAGAVEDTLEAMNMLAVKTGKQALASGRIKAPDGSPVSTP